MMMIHYLESLKLKYSFLYSAILVIKGDFCITLDNVFNTIKPKKVFLMAVDGVAPRAKMNRKELLEKVTGCRATCASISLCNGGKAES